MKMFADSSSHNELSSHLVRMAVLLVCLASMVSTAWAQNRPALAQQIIVKWKTSPSPAAAQESASRAMNGVQARFGTKMTPMRTLATQGQLMRLDRAMSTSDFQRVIRALADDPAVEYAHEDVLLKVAQQPIPNDPLYPQQAGRHVDLRVRGYNAGYGGRVAVIDSGYRPHPDLTPNVLVGYDFVSDPFIANDGDGRDASPLDPGDFAAAGDCGAGTPATNSTWHGTHVAGIIGAVSGNAYGIAGVGDGTQVLVVRALGRCGGRLSDVTDAIMWAAGLPVPGVPLNRYPARTINLSLGIVAPCLPAAQAAIDNATAYHLFTTVVAAAGNANIDAANFLPANCNNVIAVAALTRDGKKAPYSNYGTVIDVAAPGGDFTLSTTEGVISTTNAGTTAPGADTFGFKQGTSMATAHVSAIAALMSAWGLYSQRDIEIMLKVTTLQGTGPCEFPKCIRAINDHEAVVEAFAPYRYFGE